MYYWLLRLLSLLEIVFSDGPATMKKTRKTDARTEYEIKRDIDDLDPDLDYDDGQYYLDDEEEDAWEYILPDFHWNENHVRCSVVFSGDLNDYVFCLLRAAGRGHQVVRDFLAQNRRWIEDVQSSGRLDRETMFCVDEYKIEFLDMVIDKKWKDKA